MNKIIGVAGFVIVVAIALVLVFSNNSAPTADQSGESESAAEGGEETIPDLTFADYKGKQIALSSFRGKPLVVNSWAAWCPFCKEELPDFAAAQKEFGDTVTIVAVDRAEALSVAKGYTDQAGVTGGLVFLLDPSDSFYKAIGGFSMPETIFVDRKGNIIEHVRGPINLAAMREKILRLVEK